MWNTLRQAKYTKEAKAARLGAVLTPEKTPVIGQTRRNGLRATRMGVRIEREPKRSIPRKPGDACLLMGRRMSDDIASIFTEHPEERI